MILSEFFLLFFLYCLFLLTLNYSNFFASKLKLYDYPDKQRKIHLLKTPKTAGLFFFIFYSCSIFVSSNYGNNHFSIFTLLVISIFFIIGFLDDICDLSPNIRLFSTGLSLLIFLILFNDFSINKISFSFYGVVYPEFYSIFITILCYLLLTNAFNMIDGINGLAIGYFLISFISIVIFYNLFSLLTLFLLVTTLSIFILNLKGYLFLGNSGSYLLSGFLGNLIITQNNQASSILFGEEIFLILLLPGLDMLRLFIERILKNKNPFRGDNQHIHHLLIKKLKLSYSLIILFTFVASSIVLNFILNINTYLLLIIYSIIYFLIIYKLKSQ